MTTTTRTQKPSKSSNPVVVIRSSRSRDGRWRAAQLLLLFQVDLTHRGTHTHTHTYSLSLCACVCVCFGACVRLTLCSSLQRRGERESTAGSKLTHIWSCKPGAHYYTNTHTYLAFSSVKQLQGSTREMSSNSSRLFVSEIELLISCKLINIQVVSSSCLHLYCIFLVRVAKKKKKLERKKFPSVIRWKQKKQKMSKKKKREETAVESFTVPLMKKSQGVFLFLI